jgi:hypothetical protein
VENSMEAPQKIKIDLPYDLAIPILGLYPKECKSLCNKDTCTSMLNAALFTIAKSYGNNQDAQILMNRLRKCDIIDNGILFIHKEE